MKKKYSYHDCYIVLGIKPGSGWSELRKAYKRSIQKWHPDRFKDGTTEKLAAEDKIKAISIAYKQIHQYYHENGYMPAIEEVTRVVAVDTTDKSNINDKPVAPGEDKKPYAANRSAVKDKQTKSYKYLFTTLILASIYPIYYIFSSDSDIKKQYGTEYKVDENVPQNIQPASNTDGKTPTTSYLQDRLSRKNVTSEQSLEQTSVDDHDTSVLDRYFTNGSTFADVIGTQGAPTKTVGNIWFYGDSEVHFNEGKVSHWVRTTETPLKAQMTIDN